MQAMTIQTAPATFPSTTSKAARRTSTVLQTIAALFLVFDGVTKLMLIQPVRDGMAQLGYAQHLAPAIGAILLACVALYLVPRTAVLGAILLTGFLGGAVAAQVRIGSPLAGFVLFPVYMAIMLWGALWLRDERVRALFAAR